MLTAKTVRSHELTREVTIPCGEVELAGELMIPNGAAGIVLFAHGSGSSRFSPRNQHVAEILQRSSIGTLLFDLLTREEEIMDSVDGRHRFDVDLLSKRLVEATRWVTSEDKTSHLGIGYFGSSTGAAGALIAAAQIGAGIDAVVSRGGRVDLAGQFVRFVQTPTLLLVGENDRAVWELNKNVLEKLRCEKKLRIVPGASHLFEEPGALDVVATHATNWFCRHLHPR